MHSYSILRLDCAALWKSKLFLPLLFAEANMLVQLPLCLGIAGKMIKTFGSGWWGSFCLSDITMFALNYVFKRETEIPAVLKADMRDGALNLQQRVIQSGVIVVCFILSLSSL